MHPPQEEEEEVQVNLEEEAERDLMEEEAEGMDLKKDKDQSVIFVINLFILKNIVMQNCEIWNIKVQYSCLRKKE
jgi:hypothetical protein